MRRLNVGVREAKKEEEGGGISGSEKTGEERQGRGIQLWKKKSNK